MKFYTSITPFYDDIFPFKPLQKSFVESFIQVKPSLNLLDIGCGTGSLVLNLADKLDTLIGIDPDKEMLRFAQIKALKFKADRRDRLEDLGKWVFLPKGMVDLREEFAPGSFDFILCFGNTLVHLSDIKQLREFLKQAFEILKPGGRLMIQIINYDRIIDKGLKGLPTIENDKLKFERIYDYDPATKVVNFHTILTIKEDDTVIENEIPLLAIRPGHLRAMIREEGYTDLEEYGSFKKDEFQSDSQPFIVVCRK